jgi:hypothetical protein
MGFDLDFDITAVVNFLTHVGPAIQALVIGSLLCYLAVNRLIAYLDKKEKVKSRTEENEAKDKRAKEFRDLLTNVTLEMKATAATSVEVVKHVTDKLENLQETVEDLGTTMRDLRDRQAQVISKAASIAIIESKFDYIRAELTSIFDQSLRKNDYESRSDFIKMKVGMALGQVVIKAEESLHADYPGLTADLHPWFEQRGAGGSGSRYTIVDECWARVEKLYAHTAPIDERVEEMRAIINSVLTDHVQKCKDTVTDLYAHEDSLSTAQGS